MVNATDPWSRLALTATPDGTAIPIRVVPRAAKDALDGIWEGALRVRLAAPPVEGAANRALVAFLAGVLDVPKRELTIASGERGRNKAVRVRGLSPDETRRRLARATSGA